VGLFQPLQLGVVEKVSGGAIYLVEQDAIDLLGMILGVGQ
jgi:hypothetical protein